MNQNLRNKFIKIARKKIVTQDPSHDFEHAFRVLLNAEYIAKIENADLDIIVPSALFHDVICYQKNDPRSKNSTKESSDLTRKILNRIREFSKEKIDKVCKSIEICSFSKKIIPDFLEAKILQDADGLESTGAISIMRLFSSSGQMGRCFYNPDDPFCELREPDANLFSLDLFYNRLLKVQDRMHTKIAKKIAKRRTHFLKKFLKELELELKGK